jgi:hypothetical protein
MSGNEGFIRPTLSAAKQTFPHGGLPTRVIGDREQVYVSTMRHSLMEPIALGITYIQVPLDPMVSREELPMKLSIAFLFAALLSSAAFAQDSPQNYTSPPPSANTQPPPSSAGQSSDLGAIFDRLNTSHTGKLTKAEAQAIPVVAANFDAADTNHDGVVTKDEFLAAFKSQQ